MYERFYTNNEVKSVACTWKSSQNFRTE